MDRHGLIAGEACLPPRISTVADLVAIGYRWRYRIVSVFLGTMAAAFVAAFFLPTFREFESEMKILLRRERVELPLPEQVGMDARQTLGEEELNTEVELLRSDDVLRKVVQALQLQVTAKEPLWMQLFGGRTGPVDQIRIAKAISRLNDNLIVILPKKTNIIIVRYRSKDPRLSATVLNTLRLFYIDKHMTVRRPPEQLRFFTDQAEQYRERLAETERRLARFPEDAGTAAAQMELELTENRLGDLRLQYYQTEANIRETEDRIAHLQTQVASAPPRVTTVVRRSDNEYLMMQLRTTLLNLELKRTELLKKFDPSYREVQQVDEEIAQTRETIDAMEKAPMRDETTDRDKTYEWMTSELAKARADLSSFQAKAAALGASIVQHEQETIRLNRANLQQQDLQREAKTLEENYELYTRKREEARATEALDQNRLLNVSIAQMPTVPLLPRRSPWMIVLAGCILSVVLSAMTGFMSERLTDHFIGPDEMARYLDVPILAILPVGGATPAEMQRPLQATAATERNT